MPNDNPPYEPTDGREREDAFGELARAGFGSVPAVTGEHAERLARLRERVRGGASAKPEATPPRRPDRSRASTKPSEAKVLRLPPRRRQRTWWGIAAAVVAIVAGAIYQNERVSETSVPPLAEQTSAPLSPEQDAMAYEPAVVPQRELVRAPKQKPPSTLSPETVTESPAPQPVGSQVYAEISDAELPSAKIPDAERSSAEASSAQASVASAKKQLAASSATFADTQTSPSALPPASTGNLATRQADSDLAEASRVFPETGATADVADADAPAVAAGDNAMAPPPDGRAARRFSLTDGARSARDEAASEPPTRFSLAREPITDLRRITGTVADDSGAPLSGAAIEVERTGQRYVVGEDGAFDLTLPPAGRVALVTVPDTEDSLYVDLTWSDRFELVWPIHAGPNRRPQITSGIGSIVMAPLPPRAPRNEAFEAYLADVRPGLDRPVELIFNVNRRGKVSGVRLGPSFEVDREEFRRAREILEAGPLWGERWRRGKWRVVVR